MTYIRKLSVHQQVHWGASPTESQVSPSVRHMFNVINALVKLICLFSTRAVNWQSLQVEAPTLADRWLEVSALVAASYLMSVSCVLKEQFWCKNHFHLAQTGFWTIPFRSTFIWRVVALMKKTKLRTKVHAITAFWQLLINDLAATSS